MITAHPHSGLLPSQRDDLAGLASFHNPAHRWRRLFSELFGTFLLVLVAVGVDVTGHVSGSPVSGAAGAAAPALMVMAVILFMGKVGGAHLNPVISIAFSLRGEFPWGRVLPYVLAQLAGALLACVVLAALFGTPGHFGATLPSPHVSAGVACAMEVLLTLGLVSTALGTASSAQNVGPLSAIAVGGYISLAGILGGSISGASMNPVRSLAPDLIRGDLAHTWIYVVGPVVGMLIAVGCAWILRGRGHDPMALLAAQGE